ncbi:MAG: hypothetical protein ACLFQX_07510 [Candidatus Kapaibacterium sp.]
MRKAYLFILLSLFVLSSCAPTRIYFEHFETKSNDLQINKQGAYSYEDENVIVEYDFWENYGKMNFTITNKTDKMIVIDLEKSFFVKNGVSFSYYSNIIESITTTQSIQNLVQARYSILTEGVSATTGNARTLYYIPEKKLYVLPNLKAEINQFDLINGYYPHCDLLKFPASGSSKKVTYLSDKAPYTFINYITYSFVGEEKEYSFRNNFYVNLISTFNMDDYYIETEITECGKEKDVYYFPKRDPKSFYFRYDIMEMYK